MSELGATLDQWRGFARQSVAGELRLDPTVAEDCRGACEKFVGELQTMRNMKTRVNFLSGFGGFESGKAMQEKFQAKAETAPDSLAKRIDEHIEVAQMMQLTFAMSCGQLTDVDVQLRDQLAKLNPNS